MHVIKILLLISLMAFSPASSSALGAIGSAVLTSHYYNNGYYATPDYYSGYYATPDYYSRYYVAPDYYYYEPDYYDNNTTYYYYYDDYDF